MEHVKENIQKNEDVIYQAKLHWIIYTWSAIWFWILVWAITEGERDAIPGFLILFALTLIIAIKKYMTFTFAITNGRIILKKGLIRRNTFEMLLSNVESIYVNQGYLGRSLGYGSISVTGSGGTCGPVHRIATPLEFKKKVLEQIDPIENSVK